MRFATRPFLDVLETLYGNPSLRAIDINPRYREWLEQNGLAKKARSEFGYIIYEPTDINALSEVILYLRDGGRKFFDPNKVPLPRQQKLPI